jgi:hypothetical protein
MPDAPLVIAIQLALLIAVQLVPVDSDVEPVPAAAVILAALGSSEEADAACVTVKVSPAMVMVPTRGLVLGFAATE